MEKLECEPKVPIQKDIPRGHVNEQQELTVVVYAWGHWEHLSRDKRTIIKYIHWPKWGYKCDYKTGKSLELNPETNFSGQQGRSRQWLQWQPSDPHEGLAEHQIAFQIWDWKVKSNILQSPWCLSTTPLCYTALVMTESQVLAPAEDLGCKSNAKWSQKLFCLIRGSFWICWGGGGRRERDPIPHRHCAGPPEVSVANWILRVKEVIALLF